MGIIMRLSISSTCGADTGSPSPSQEFGPEPGSPPDLGLGLISGRDFPRRYRAGSAFRSRIRRWGCLRRRQLAAACSALGKEALDRLTGLEQRAAGDLETAVALLLERVERFPKLAIGVDDMHALRDPVSFRPRLAELEALVAVHRRVGVLDHVHEDLGTGEQLPDRGRRKGVGGRGIVAAECLLLRADHVLSGSHVIAGACGRDKRKETDQEQGDGAHLNIHRVVAWCSYESYIRTVSATTAPDGCVSSAPGRSDSRSALAYRDKTAVRS